jgi:hypothetical protein
MCWASISRLAQLLQLFVFVVQRLWTSRPPLVKVAPTRACFRHYQSCPHRPRPPMRRPNREESRVQADSGSPHPGSCCVALSRVNVLHSSTLAVRVCASLALLSQRRKRASRFTLFFRIWLRSAKASMNIKSIDNETCWPLKISARWFCASKIAARRSSQPRARTE